MGCGKSSVGRELSRLLCCPFTDLDSVIEETAGRTIPEIFANDGEAAFRRMEAAALENIVLPSAMGPTLCGQRGSTVSVSSPDRCHTEQGNFRTNALTPIQAQTENPHCHPERREGVPELVLSLGGGAVMTPECAEMVHEKTMCIYLRATIDTLVDNLEYDSDSRPLLNTTDLRTRIEDLMSRRSAIYENTAHVIIDTDGKSIEAIASEIISILG